MTAPDLPGRTPLPLSSGQKRLLSLSSGLLAASVLVLIWAMPRLPERIPTHWSGVSAPDAYGPPGTLWALWGLQLGLGLLLGWLAWQAPAGRLRLNGIPPVTSQNAGRVGHELRTLFLTMQALVTLLLTGLAVVTVVVSLGGPNLIALCLWLLVLIPLGLGYSLYRVSSPSC